MNNQTRCKNCVHKHVCAFDFDRNCENFDRVTYEHRNCSGCKNKDRSPECFQCQYFLDVSSLLKEI